MSAQPTADDWKNENAWKNLPKYWQGQQITYTVTETAPATLDGYTKGPASTSGTIAKVNNSDYHESSTRTITNTRTVDVTAARLTKTWSDHDNQDGLRMAPVDYAKCVCVTADGAALYPRWASNATTFPLYYDSGHTNPVRGQGRAQATLTIRGSNDKNSDGTPKQDGDLAYNTYTVTCANLPRHKNVDGTVSEIQYVLYETATEGGTNAMSVNDRFDANYQLTEQDSAWRSRTRSR